MDLVLLVHAATTLAMTGLIWFVQRVHYPLFEYSSIGDFTAFALDHQKRTGQVVAPLMIVEAVTAAWLVVALPESTAAWLGATLLVSIWLSTALVQVPLHRQLSNGFDSRAAKLLVTTNWWRTLAWTARAGFALHLLRTA